MAHTETCLQADRVKSSLDEGVRVIEGVKWDIMGSVGEFEKVIMELGEGIPLL